jgi:beta-1,4-mannosyl-glycoprotein beta-1,4-N-acetylglucosaminyltransferase
MSSKRIAICYWGLTRSLSSVYTSHVETIFKPLKEHGFIYDIFLHSWITDRPIIDSKDKQESTTNTDYKILNPYKYRYDNQDDFENSLDMSDYFDKDLWNLRGDALDGEWRPQLIKNHLFALESMKRVTQLCIESGIQYDYVFYVRPDVLVYNPFPVDILNSMTDETVGIPNFDHHEGYNDRFAIVPFSNCAKYGCRIDGIKEFRKTYGRIVSEKYLKYVIDRNFKEVKLIHFNFDIIRPTDIEWIDSILFNGEEIIKLRIQYLYYSISKFYICEQRYTHQGQRKEILYIEKYKDWFEPYMDKIVFLVDEEEPSSALRENTWIHENRHRNYTVPFILNAHTKYICTVCDCDEIPNKIEIIKNIESIYVRANTGAVRLEQDLLYYNLNWFVCKWSCPFIVSDKLLSQYKEFNRFRGESGPHSGSINGGWHLSYFMSPDEILRKIQSFGHREFNTDEYKNKEYVMKCINEGYDLYKRQSTPYSRYDKTRLPSEILIWETNPFR